MTGELLSFGFGVLIVAAVGIWLGMLVAPRVGRWAEREDEKPGDGDDDV
jgi:hypothetical protein